MTANQRTDEEKTQPGVDKVTRYHWTIKNAPGEFLMIPKAELEVDHAYQRNRVNQRRVDELCRAWDWIACGCLVVALREDNKWFVMDGQHRKLAADMRSDIRDLPCLVFETSSRRDEALGFLSINQGRVGVGCLDRYRAQLLAGDKMAFALETIVKSTGHRFGHNASPRTISCVQCLYNLVREDRERFERLWPLLAELHPDGPMTDAVIKGLWVVDKWLAKAGLGFAPHEITILMAEGLLKPLGRPPTTGVKYFSAVALGELRRDQKWLARASDCVVQYWKQRNEKKTAQRGQGHDAPRVPVLNSTAAALN